MPTELQGPQHQVVNRGLAATLSMLDGKCQMRPDSPVRFRYDGAMRDATEKVTRSVPMDPDRFGEVLRLGVAAGELAFT
eukprot:9154325-Alexandrium_andersonii.AAC.1